MDWHQFSKEWLEEAKRQGFKTGSLVEVDGMSVPFGIKGGQESPCLYLSSGVHGDEPSGPQALMGLLKEGFFGEGIQWLICPLLNPTGLVAGTRENSRGVDLNRDYRQCQTEEVCAHIRWLKEQCVPEMFLSLHEDWESTGFYFYEINLGGKGPTHEEILEAASVSFPPEPELVIDDHEVDAPGWIYHSENPDIPEGWPEAIYLAKSGCPLSLTFETPSSALLADRIRCHQTVVKEAVKRFLDRRD